MERREPRFESPNAMPRVEDGDVIEEGEIEKIKEEEIRTLIWEIVPRLQQLEESEISEEKREKYEEGLESIKWRALSGWASFGFASTGSYLGLSKIAENSPEMLSNIFGQDPSVYEHMRETISTGAYSASIGVTAFAALALMYSGARRMYEKHTLKKSFKNS